MSEHRGASFSHSCVKVPVDPYSRQPTPSYERPQLAKSDRSHSGQEKNRKINFAKNDQPIADSDTSSAGDNLENFLEFLDSIPDYGQVNHLTNEQFKQKVDYLKRKQRLFLKNLKNCLNEDTGRGDESVRTDQTSRMRNAETDRSLKLNGKKCYFEESRTNSPMLYPSSSFASLAENQDLLTYRSRSRDKEAKTIRNKEIHSANKSWSTWSGSKSDESLESDIGDNAETKSLPPDSSKDWHPTVPKPFRFTLREEAEKYMTLAEMEADRVKEDNNHRSPTRKRRVRPIPLTSKIPLYDKLLAEKEERSRIVREESALNLMSQVRPFRLECDRRAWRSMTRSSPEVCGRSESTTSRFRAKPVPRNLFGTEVYDRMLEDEYYRQLKKKIRAAELMKSSSLPPSMARRERVKSACNLQGSSINADIDDILMPDCRESSRLANFTPMPSSERSRSSVTMLPSRGNNLAAVLRCQASREKLERELREKMEEKRREQEVKFRESIISRKPAWRALRSAARHENDRDRDIRATLRRDEAREQSERHRLHMEMMLDRVTQIPTLFERHSQTISKMQAKCYAKVGPRKRKKKSRKQTSSSDSYIDFGSTSRPNSGSLTSSSGTLASLSQSSKSSKSSKSTKSTESAQSKKSTAKSETVACKKKGDRGHLKVSINETAKIIEDQKDKSEEEENEKLYSDRSFSEEHDVSHTDENDTPEE